MRMGPALLISLATATGASAQAPQERCSAAEHRQFDFWIGTWTVYLPNGQVAGTNRIEPILGGCVLYESWTANGPSRGHSFNSYDPGTRKWHQTWVDNSGTLLLIDGGIVNGEMVMEGKRTLPDGSIQLERITWSPRPDGTIRQLWQTSTSEGMRWSVTFDGVYRRTPPRPDGR